MNSYNLIIAKNENINEAIQEHIEDLIEYAIKINSFEFIIDIDEFVRFDEKIGEDVTKSVGSVDFNLLDYIDCDDFLNYVHYLIKENK